MIQATLPTPLAKSVDAGKPEAVTSGFAALVQLKPTLENPLVAEGAAVVSATSGDLSAIEPSEGQIEVPEGLEAALMSEGGEAPHNPQTTPDQQLVLTDADPLTALAQVLSQAPSTDATDQNLQGIATVVSMAAPTDQPTQSLAAPFTANNSGQTPSPKEAANSLKSAALTEGEAMPATPQRAAQSQPLTVPLDAKNQPEHSEHSEHAVTPTVMPKGVETTGSPQSLSVQQMTDGAKHPSALPLQSNPQGKAIEHPLPELQRSQGAAAAAPLSTASPDKPTISLQGPNLAEAVEQQSTPTKTVISTATAGPAQELAKPAATALVAQGQPAVMAQDRNKVPGLNGPLTALPQTVLSKTASSVKDAALTEPSLQDGRSTERPVTMTEVFAKTKILTGLEKPVIFVGKPANGSSAPLNIAEPEQMVQAAALTATGLNAGGVKVPATAEASVKPPAKPFAEALMSQIKSVEASQGRTTVNLVPRGLGSIEIEVFTENDGAAKVVVRVENPAVLQALRDDRQFLAEAIGVSDSSIFDFQEQSAGEQSNPHHKSSGQSGDALTNATVPQSQEQHLDVVQDGHLDIMT